MHYSQILTFEDACKALNISTNVPDVSSWPEEMQAGKIAEYKLSIVIKAANAGWYPDWKDGNQPKYWPWFDRIDGGFSFLDVVNRYQYSYVGSRLCFVDRATATHVATTFLDLYRESYA